jgi:chromosome segregation ATPase
MNIKEFLDFVAFIKDVDKYEARVKTLKDENDRLEANIRLTSEVAEVSYNRELAAKLHEEAKQVLADAKVVAAETKARSKTVYEKRLEEVVAREGAVRDASERNALALKEAKDLNEQLNAALQKQLAVLDAKEASLAEAEKEVKERLAKLKSVMG